jgi:hypothetical protein
MTRAGEAAAATLGVLGLLAVSCSTGATDIVGGARVRTATASGTIYGVRTSADDRSLVVGYEDGGCNISGRGKLAQTSSVVTLTALVTYAVPGKGDGCPGVSRPRTFVVRIARPLGHRRLVDGATGHTITPFDGAALLKATATPDGLTVKTDVVTPAGRDGLQPNWTQVYSRPGRLADTQCTSGGSPTVTVTQGHDVGTLQASSFLTRIPGRHTVDGASAQLFYQSGIPGNTGLYDLRWNVANRRGWAVLIQVQQMCRRGFGLTATQLMHFANGLRRARAN